MNNHSCFVMINCRALKEYLHVVIGQPEAPVAMSRFILLLASTEIWDVSFRQIYDLHRLVGNLKGVYDVHLSIKDDIVVLFSVINPLKIKIKSIGSHNDIFD